MIKFLILLAVLFAAAFGFQWLKHTPGDVTLTLGDTAYAVDLPTALVGLVIVALVVMLVIWLVRVLLRAPWSVAHGWRRRNVERGRQAISRGLIAVAAGDLRGAERAMSEAKRRAPQLPLARLLQAQTAQLRGDRAAARAIFQEMTEVPDTRIAGLRGLYIEAEREGEHEAAYRIAALAREEAPSAAWAARALLHHQTAGADWDGALKTLSGAADGRVIDKRTARRQRAVILTAKALAMEESEPDVARQAALEAHDLANDLVPAAVVAGRLLARQGDVRRTTRVLEATWKVFPHPEIADAYLHARSGDAALDRLKRAETLHRIRPHVDEGRRAVARAAIDARDFQRARDALAPILTTRPTQKALILMAELEEAETGDRARARGWLARAVYAPRDPAWTADGMVLEAWAPITPVSGRLDGVEWKVPLAELEGPKIEVDTADLAPPPLPALDPAEAARTVEQPAKAPEIATEPPKPAEPPKTAEAPKVTEPPAAVVVNEPPPTVTPVPPGDASPAPAPAPEAKSAPKDAPAAPEPPKEPPHVTLVASQPDVDPPADEPPKEPPRPDDPGVGDDEERQLPVFLKSRSAGQG